MLKRKIALNQIRGWTKSFLLLVCLGLAGAGFAWGQEPTSSRIAQSEKEPQNWITFYGNYGAWSYSRLDQINRKTVSDLVPVWAFPTGAPPNDFPRWGLEAAPLVMDGALYLEGPQNNVYAADAATGRPLWTYAYKLPTIPFPSSRGARGLASSGKELWEAYRRKSTEASPSPRPRRKHCFAAPQGRARHPSRAALPPDPNEGN